MWFAGPARRVPEAGRPATLRLGFTLTPGMRVGLYGGSVSYTHLDVYKRQSEASAAARAARNATK